MDTFIREELYTKTSSTRPFIITLKLVVKNIISQNEPIFGREEIR